MIYLEPKHAAIVQAILAKYPYTFFAFGSRVQGTHKALSDLDICFTQAIPWHEQAAIEEDFEESDLPFTVDLVDWNVCDAAFREKIRAQWVRLSGSG